MSTRAENIKGLRELADWLEANPDVPLGKSDMPLCQYSVNAYEPYASDWDAACREIVRIAELVDRQVDVPDRGFRKVERWFGPVRYVAVASLDDRDEEPAEEPAETEGATP